MMKVIFLLSIIFLPLLSSAQSHTYNACCLLSNSNVKGDCSCPGCKDDADKAFKAQQAEAKKKADREKAERDEIERKFQEEQALRAKNQNEEEEARKKNVVEFSIGGGGSEKTSSTSEKKVAENSTAQKKAAEKKETATPPSKVDEEATRLEFQRRLKESQAKALEKEGDQFNSMGSAFMGMALKKYEEAQQIYYSAIVQTKIDNIKALQQTAKLVNDGLDKAEDFAIDMRTTMDDAGIPQWRVTSFSYEGYSPGFDGYQTAKTLNPQSYSINYGFYRIFAMEMGFTYYNSPVYKLGLEDNNNKYTGKDIEGSYTSVGPEVSIGLALPIKHIAVYALYGYYFPFVISGTPYSAEYKYDSDFKDNFGIATPIRKLKFGAFISIPKTRVGIGLKYTLNAINGEKMIPGSSSSVTDVNGYKYGLGHGNYSSVDKLKYNSLGISFIIKSK